LRACINRCIAVKLDKTAISIIANRVREGFLHVAKNESERVILIKGEQSINQITEQIWQNIRLRMNFE